MTKIDDLILVSVDDHVVEPPDMFEGRLPAKYADLAPRVVEREGIEYWVYEGQLLPNIGLNAVAGLPPDEYGFDPTAFREMRPGCYDIHERVRDMSANGVLGSMCFPSFPQFCGQLFARTEDKDVALAMVRAYNDWHIEDWCGTYPGRFIPLALPAIWDPDVLAEEVHRVAALGCHAITFSENPAALGHPSFHSDSWDPFWRACSEVGTVVCLHIGSSSKMSIPAEDSPITVMTTLHPVNLMMSAADLLWSPVLRKWPDVKFALSEGGIGWIPYFLERVDYVYHHHKAWTNQDFGDRLPSEVFRDHVLTCFIDDDAGLALRDRIGIDNIAWESDYPHSDSTWPRSPETLYPSLEGVPTDEIDAITHRNAMRWFQYDPFAHRPRETCTVGALRAEAADVDVSVRSVKERATQRPSGPVLAMDIARHAQRTSR